MVGRSTLDLTRRLGPQLSQLDKFILFSFPPGATLKSLCCGTCGAFPRQHGPVVSIEAGQLVELITLATWCVVNSKEDIPWCKGNRSYRDVQVITGFRRPLQTCIRTTVRVSWYHRHLEKYSNVRMSELHASVQEFQSQHGRQARTKREARREWAVEMQHIRHRKTQKVGQRSGASWYAP